MKYCHVCKENINVALGLLGNVQSLHCLYG